MVARGIRGRNDSQREREVQRGDFLLSGAFLASLGALLLNDFVLKPYWPGYVSGILSDVAGMVFFPLLLVAFLEALALLFPRRPLATLRWFVAATLVVSAAFVLVKFTAWGESAYWSIASPLASLAGPLGLGTTGVIADPLDLLALLMAPVPVLVGFRYRPTTGAAHPNE